MIELGEVEYIFVVISMMFILFGGIFLLRWYVTGYEEDEEDEGDSGGEG
jgi:hypothetical protein